MVAPRYAEEMPWNVRLCHRTYNRDSESEVCGTHTHTQTPNRRETNGETDRFASVFAPLCRPTAQRVRGLPPKCEIELRPYAKVGRKKARDVLGCARVPEADSPDLDTGVFHKFLKMDFAEVAPCEDMDLAEASPSLIVSVYTKLGEKKIVSGRAEMLLASLCGYKNLNGEAVLRLPRRHRNTRVGPNDYKAGADTGYAVLRGSAKKPRLGLDEADDFSCPVAAVDKAIPLLEDGSSSCDGSNAEGASLWGGGRGGELRLRALYVPDRLADGLGVRSAIKVRIRATYSMSVMSARAARYVFCYVRWQALERSKSYLGRELCRTGGGRLRLQA